MSERWVLVPTLQYCGGGTTIPTTGNGTGDGLGLYGGGVASYMDKEHGNGTTGQRWGTYSTGGGRGNGVVLPRSSGLVVTSGKVLSSKDAFERALKCPHAGSC